MAESQLRLLLSRRLLPLFVTQFLGAVNDNLFKNALVILVAYRDTTNSTATQIVVTIATALFILPYFLFSATAGQLADKYDKAWLIRFVKIWEIGVMVLAAIGFALDGTIFQLAILFLLGIQATFFGPVKYGVLPELLAPDELLAGNALIEAGTFLAILIGTIAGGLLILVPSGPAIVSALMIALAVAGWAASLAMPSAGAAMPELKIDPNMAAETWAILRYTGRDPALNWPIIGISWFWLVGAAFLAQFPNYAKIDLGADNQVVTLFLTIFSIGIGAGSLLCSRIEKGAINTRLVPVGALGMALFALDLSFAGGTPAAAGLPLTDALAFLGTAGHWRILGDLFLIAVSGGLYIVPLYAMLQARSEARHRARVIASNNIWNAIFIIASAILSAAILQLGLGITAIFLTMAASNGALAVATMRLGRRM